MVIVLLLKVVKAAMRIVGRAVRSKNTLRIRYKRNISVLRGGGTERF
jgi:hypothetical protein